MWVAAQPIDVCRTVYGLVALVGQGLGSAPYSGDMVFLRSRRNDRIKLLAWDGRGIMLVTRRLEHGHLAHCCLVKYRSSAAPW